MKYAITHCYTDRNKGDAAIIIATIQLIRAHDNSAKISCFSTYGPNDTRLTTEHKFIGRYADAVFPGFFYQAEAVSWLRGQLSRGVSYISIFTKCLLLLVSTNQRFVRYFLTDIEVRGLKEFVVADIVISKGGSYLTTQNTSIRQTLSLFSMLYPFIFCKRYKKKIVIFGQSLGPVVGAFNCWLMQKSLSGVSRVYLRENLCREIYPVIDTLLKSLDTRVIPDTAFFEEESEVGLIREKTQIDSGDLNVGLTLVDHGFKYLKSTKDKTEKRNAYKKSISDLIVYLLKSYGTRIYVYPQVQIEDSLIGTSDALIAEEVLRELPPGTDVSRVIIYNDNFSPAELREMYSNMDVFIGTRLHSVIFAMSRSVPAINISYHGTKSKGVLEGILNNSWMVLDIDTLTSNSLIETAQRLISSRVALISVIAERMVHVRAELMDAMKEVVELAADGS